MVIFHILTLPSKIMKSTTRSGPAIDGAFTMGSYATYLIRRMSIRLLVNMSLLHVSAGELGLTMLVAGKTGQAREITRFAAFMLDHCFVASGIFADFKPSHVDMGRAA
jgi:hypothetical protein